MGTAVRQGWGDVGPRATDAYIEFFSATIRNRNTRLAYARACYQFFHWCQENGLTLDTVRPFHVAAYIEQMSSSKPTIKQKLAAIRMLYDFLEVCAVNQVVPAGVAAAGGDHQEFLQLRKGHWPMA